MTDEKKKKKRTSSHGKITGEEVSRIILYTLLYWGGYGVILMIAEAYLPEYVIAFGMNYPLQYVLTQVGFALGVVFVGVLYAHYHRR